MPNDLHGGPEMIVLDVHGIVEQQDSVVQEFEQRFVVVLIRKGFGQEFAQEKHHCTLAGVKRDGAQGRCDAQALCRLQVGALFDLGLNFHYVHDLAHVPLNARLGFADANRKTHQTVMFGENFGNLDVVFVRNDPYDDPFHM